MTMQRVIVKTGLEVSQQSADLGFWLAQSVQARIDALEELRSRHNEGRPEADTRLQRGCRITQLKQG